MENKNIIYSEWIEIAENLYKEGIPYSRIAPIVGANIENISYIKNLPPYSGMNKKNRAKSVEAKANIY